jgi:ribosomal protein L32
MCLMDEVASGNRHNDALLSALQSSSSASSDSFTTSAVFVCPHCGLHVDVRHRICHSCHRELDFCGLDACEQELGASRGSSDGTVIDSSHSGSSSPAVDEAEVVQFELSNDSSGF